MKLSKSLTLIILTALICITGLELFALNQGIDGLILTGVIGSLAAIPTWFITRQVTKRKKKRGRK